MNIVGVIAEYNPFHQGHRYHLQKAKELTGSAAAICVMSGHFLQRGEPAIFDKWARTEMALAQGADLVLELPALYATRSAYWFARGGVETLYQTGVVTHLSFGAETAELNKLSRAAELIAGESAAFKEDLRTALKEGLSFPAARAKALGGDVDSPSMLASPNNVLALSYLQILHEKNIPLTPAPVQRSGAAYDETALLPREFPSATAIRRKLSCGDNASLVGYLAPSTLEIIDREGGAGRGPVFMEALDGLLMGLLRRSTAEELQNIIEVNEGLENRIRKIAQKAAGCREFLALLKTKRYTYTRLQRFLIHLLLGYTQEKEAYLLPGPPYLRVLGFTAAGQKILRKIKKEAALPLITKGAYAEKHASGDAAFRVFWEMDVLAGSLYALLYPEKTVRQGNPDYYRQPVTWPRMSSADSNRS
ncbi:MAG: nucleotidyltransferase [Clostridia bacterium]|jgi:predicted nucleotidyltransferase|nr:nucleotidyltransferase [Clostridia bacterium]